METDDKWIENDELTPLMRAKLQALKLCCNRCIAHANEPSAADVATPVLKMMFTILENTVIRVITNGPMSSLQAKQDAPMLFTVSEDVFVGDALAIPRGTTLHGTVVQSKSAGALTGSNELTVRLTSMDLGDRSYPLYVSPYKVTGANKARPTETKAVRGALVGAIVGGIVGSPSANAGTTDVGRAASMTTGAAVGAGVGTIVSAGTSGPRVWIPAETQIDFTLTAPLTVPPVSAKEAERLERRFHPGSPSLNVRDTAH